MEPHKIKVAYIITSLGIGGIVHTHMPHTAIWGRIAAFLTGTKIIMTTEHGYSVWRKGLALLEAGAAGKACIASSVTGIPEIIEDSLNGVLVPPGEPGILAEKIIWLLKNKNISTQMGLYAKKIVQNKFNITNTTKNLELLYLNSIKRCKNYRVPHRHLCEIK